MTDAQILEIWFSKDDVIDFARALLAAERDKQSLDAFFDANVDGQDTVSREWLRNFLEKWERHSAESAKQEAVYQERAALNSNVWFDVSIVDYRLRLDTDGPDWVRIVYATPPQAFGQIGKPVMWVILDKDGNLVGQSMTPMKGLDWEPLYRATPPQASADVRDAERWREHKRNLNEYRKRASK